MKSKDKSYFEDVPQPEKLYEDSGIAKGEFGLEYEDSEYLWHLKFQVRS